MPHAHTAPKSSDDIISPYKRERWIHGCRMLACAQDMIVMDGPSKFVKRCLESGTDDTPSHRGLCVYWLFVVVFIVVVPFCMPIMFVEASMKYSIGYSMASRSDGMQLNGGDDFVMTNVKIDMHKLEHAFRYYENVTADQHVTPGERERSKEAFSGVMYLDEQGFQAKMKRTEVQVLTGLGAIIVIVLTTIVRNSCGSQYYCKWFVFNVLHFYWFAYDPKLKFTNVELLGGAWKLYALVPAAWFSIVVSFTLVVPFMAYYFTNDLEHLLVGFPASITAAWLGGRLYIQLVSSTATFWLFDSPRRLTIARRGYEAGVPTLFCRLAEVDRNPAYALVTIEEIELITTDRLFQKLELWLMQKSLAVGRTAFFNTSETLEYGELSGELESCLETGKWADVQSVLEKRDAALRTMNGASYMSGCLLKEVYISDNRGDKMFVVDLRAGTLSHEDERRH
eukprot:CAMPEP_0117545856 /NCGR_PEP_ID=MMETSP0784-20121206/46311_1 /TAXON_ID=39447 /ORGANISM="" /LENGTH=451 /DNA_ID=CAMNT_0005342717 /DNA_START=59 /DNA_END=1414 /DNA_ORIENTATION=-